MKHAIAQEQKRKFNEEYQSFFNRKSIKRILNRWQLYLMISIPLIYIIIFNYIPMLGLQLAFKKFDSIAGIWGSQWIGMKNFTKFFKSYQFDRVITNTIIISVYNLIAGFPIPIIFALLLNVVRGKVFKKTVQMVTYLPYFISVVVLVGMTMQMFDSRIGIVATLYSFITGQQMPEILGNPNAFPHLYVWSGIWQKTGWNSIIYIAALASVDNELHEASTLDGATRFQRVRYIDFPCIIPTAIILLILNAGKMMNVGFEKVYLMQNPLNLRTSEIISTYVYKVGLTGNTDFAYATAIGLFNSIINLLLIVTVNYVAKRVSDSSLW